MHIFKALAVAVAALGFSATGAFAVTLNLDAVSGTWGNIAETGGLAPVAGAGTNKIEWGVPCCGNNTTNGSSYVFDGAGAANNVSSPFTLGTFTHNNFTISSDSSSLLSADLTVSVSGFFDAMAFALNPVFSFTHLETANGASPCAAGGSQPCPDLVTLVNSQDLSQVVDLGGGQLVTLTILGFDTGSGPLSTFLTKEQFANSARLVAQFSAPEPPGPVVPLPASAWLMLAAFGGLAAAGRARR